MKTNKKAELTTMQIGIVVLLIVSALIILFVYNQFKFTSVIDRETCHNSVILKASTPTIQERKVLDFPLRCKTNKICFVLNKGETCDKFVDSKTKKMPKEIESVVTKSERDVNAGIANLLYDCWWMMGEGKVDIFSRSFQAKSYSGSCVECAQVDFSPNLKKQYAYINGFYSFLNEEKIAGTEIKYADFLLSNLGVNPREPAFSQLDRISTGKSYSIMFLQYSRTTAPEDIGAGIGAVVGALAPELVKLAGEIPYVGPVFKIIDSGISLVSKLFGEGKVRTVTGIVGLSAGRGVGASIGGLIGDRFVSLWMILPASSPGSSSTPVSQELSYITDLKKFGEEKGFEKYCSAKSIRNIRLVSGDEYYGLMKDSSALYFFDKSQSKFVEQPIGEAQEKEKIDLPSSFSITNYNSAGVAETYSVMKQSDGKYMIRSNVRADEEYYIAEIPTPENFGRIDSINQQNIQWPAWMKTQISDSFKTKASILRGIASELYAQCYGLSKIQCNWESIV